MTHLELLEDTYKKLNIEYHRIISPTNPDYVYIQIMKAHDTKGHILVSGYGLVELKDPGQLTNFVEFYQGEMVSY